MTFNPATLSGKRLWLRAKDNTSGSVSTWVDQSGTSHSGTAVGTAPVVAAGSTPGGGKSVAFSAGYFNLPALAFLPVVSASSFFDSTVPPRNAFDGNTGTMWASAAPAPQWLRVDVNSARVVTSYSVRPQSGFLPNAPTAWTFEGSNDGSSWTVLDTRSGVSWPNTNAQVFNFTNAAAFSKYRLNASAATGNVAISELTIDGITREAEMWVVIKSNLVDVAAWVLGNPGWGGAAFPFAGTVYEDFGSDGRLTFTPTVSLNAWRLYRVTRTETQLKAYLDETLQGTAAFATFEPTAPTLGGKSGSNFSGNIAEVLIRDRVSTADEVAWLIDYFNTEHGLSVAGGVAPPSDDRTGTVAGTLPALTGSAAGTVTAPTFTGSVAGALPALTGSIAGTHVSNDQVGTVAGTLPALTGSVEGDVTAPAITGTASGTLPPLTGLAEGSVVVNGTVAGTLPALTGYASDGSGNVTAAVAGALPTLTGGVVADVPTTTLDPWTADLDGRTGLTLNTPEVELSYTPPLQLLPPGMHERTLRRKSHIVPALHTIAGIRPDPITGAPVVPAEVWAALDVIEEDLGTIHVTVQRNGRSVDVTYFRGGQTLPVSDTMEEPFGDKDAQFRLPQVTSLDEQPDNPDHPLWWQQNRADIKIVLKRPDGTLKPLWSGLLISDDTGNSGGSPIKTKDAIGALWQAAYDVHQVPNYLEPTDVGTLIAKNLNRVASRNYPAIAPVVTGINSRDRGSWSQSALAYVQGILARDGWTEAGNQWTVAKVPNTRWTYVIRQKKTTHDWTVTNGAHGVEVNLSRDITQGRNVVFGRWVAPNGYAGLNTKYPGMHGDTAPLFPGVLMGLGATDASSNGGVSVWQRRARDLGYTIAIDGTISGGDVVTIRTVQRRYGVSVDGVIGPQTWAATFGVGSNVGDLKAVIRLPLAADPRTQKWLYNADGSRAGLNPDYDSNVLVVSDDVDFGAGVTRAEAVQSAQQIVDRESTPSLTGTIKLTTDPREGSRLFIPAGDKIQLVGYEHTNPVLHISRRSRAWLDPTLPVTLDVDERSRDALTVSEVRAARRESMRDPARRPGNANRRSAADMDQVVPFDGESGAGRIPKHALYGGLWTVVRIPVSELGRVAKVDVRTSGPACRFALALFGAPIQANHLRAYVGNPLASDNPFKAHATLLEDRFGFIEGWGQKGQACGYGRGTEGEGDPLTGQFLETAGFEYVSAKPPWIWVAEYATASCFIEGRILPAAVV